MKLSSIVEALGLESKGPESIGDREVTSGYASDNLSQVVFNADRGCLWVTRLAHQNIVTVAALKEMAGVVIAGGLEPDNGAIVKALVEGVPLLVSTSTVAEVVDRLYSLGISFLPKSGRLPAAPGPEARSD